MSWTAGIPVGTLKVQGCMPEKVLVVNDRDEHRTYVPEKTATHMIINNGTTGHCACTRCGKPIYPWDAWCRHCGAKLEGGWK